jgi:hypothetical protein
LAIERFADHANHSNPESPDPAITNQSSILNRQSIVVCNRQSLNELGPPLR